jgi:hypothetical protein
MHFAGIDRSNEWLRALKDFSNHPFDENVYGICLHRQSGQVACRVKKNDEQWFTLSIDKICQISTTYLPTYSVASDLKIVKSALIKLDEENIYVDPVIDEVLQKIETIQLKRSIGEVQWLKALKEYSTHCNDNLYDLPSQHICLNKNSREITTRELDVDDKTWRKLTFREIYLLTDAYLPLYSNPEEIRTIGLALVDLSESNDYRAASNDSSLSERVRNNLEIQSNKNKKITAIQVQAFECQKKTIYTRRSY